MAETSPPLHIPNAAQQDPSLAAPTSAHRAFIYAITLPGLGDLYAQAWLRGTLALGLFIGFFAWCAWLLHAWAGSVFGGPAFPGGLAGSGWAALYGLYFVWLCSILSAVHSACGLRRREGTPPQRSLGWACAMAWLCPGAGQVYAGAALFGCVLFAAYLAANLLSIPAYKASGLALKGVLANAGALSSPTLLLPSLAELHIRLKFCYAALLQEGITCVAIAETAHALQGDWRRLFARDREAEARPQAAEVGEDFVLSAAERSNAAPGVHASGQPDLRALPFSRRPEGRVLGLTILGWLCPGAGQMLLGRTALGWTLLAAFVGGRLFIGALLGAGYIAPTLADMLAWVPLLFRLYAMIDAPVRLVRRPGDVPSG